MGEYIVEAKNLCKYFKAGKNQTLKAVDGVNIQLKKGGEALGGHKRHGAVRGKGCIAA